MNSVRKLYKLFFQDIIDDDSDLEDISIVPSSKVNQRSVCLLHECYHDCLVSDWKVITLLREVIQNFTY